MIGYPSGQYEAILPAQDTAFAPQRKFNVLSHVLNPLLDKLVQSRWLDIGLVLFCVFIALDFVLLHKHVKKELSHDPAILTSQTQTSPLFWESSDSDRLAQKSFSLASYIS